MPCHALQQGATPLHFAAFQGHAHVARVLLAGGAPLEAKDSVRACLRSPGGLAELSQAYGSLRRCHTTLPLTVRHSLQRHWTPLHVAAFYGQSKVRS
jgi:hypothetical protein